MRRCRGSGPEPAGPGGLPGLSVLLLSGHRRGHQEARGLLRYLGGRGERAHPLVSGRGRAQAFIQNPCQLSGGNLVLFLIFPAQYCPHICEETLFSPFRERLLNDIKK